MIKTEHGQDVSAATTLPKLQANDVKIFGVHK